MGQFLLHTKSSEYEGPTSFNGRTSKSDFNAAINYAEAKEMDFYRKFNCSSLQQFLSKIKELLAGAQKDREVLMRFQNVNIQTLMSKELGNVGLGHNNIKVISHINTKGLKIPLSFNSKQSNGLFEIISSVDGELNVGIEPKASAIKAFLNAITNDPSIQEAANISGTNFKVEATKNEKSLSTSMRKIIGSLGTNDLVSINLQGVNGSLTEESILTPRLSKNKNGFAWTASELNKLKEINPDKYNQIVNNIQSTLDRLMDGASNELRQAFNEIYGRIDVVSLLGKKGKLYQSIMGGMGEFGTMLWMRYFEIKLTNSGLPKTPQIEAVGQQLRYGKESAVDIKFLENLGIQVKNYNTAITKSVSTSRPLADVPNEPLQKYLANCAFNSSIPYNEGNVIQYIANNIGEFLNLTISDVLSGASDNTVSFYAIGNNLIPASVVYKSMVEPIVNGEGGNTSGIRITGINPIGSDADFGSVWEDSDGRHYMATHEGYAIYVGKPYHATGPQDFEQGPKIAEMYGRLLGRITIQANIHFSAMISSGSYTLL